MLWISPIKDRKTIRNETIEDSLDKEHICYRRWNTIQRDKDKTKKDKHKISNIATSQRTDKRKYELCIISIHI